MFLFVVFALIALAAAVGVITSRKPVYSALFLLLNFATLAALYIMVEAQFLAAVQIIVYAGAVIVLFLFVVMLIGGGELDDIGGRNKKFLARLTWPRGVALVLGLGLLVAVGYGLLSGQLMTATNDAAAFGQGSVQAIAAVLYTDYALPFELASILLLVGMIGAVALAQPPKKD